MLEEIENQNRARSIKTKIDDYKKNTHANTDNKINRFVTSFAFAPAPKTAL